MSSSNIVSESARHQTANDAAPQLQPNLLTLYSMKYCPFAQRTRLVLQHKGVQHQIVNISLTSKPSWFLEKGPAGKVPVLEEPGSDFVLEESLVTSDYIEEAYPQQPLYPRAPKQRALIRVAISKWGDCIPAYYRCLFAGDDKEAAEQSWQQLVAGVKNLQQQLRGGKFFGGCETPQMADFMIWPWFERLPTLAKLRGVQLPEAELRPLLDWMAAMASVPAVLQTRAAGDIHEAFYRSVIAGKAQYDL